MNILDTIFPRWCIFCGRRLIEGERYLCLHCLAKMPYTFLWQSPEDNRMIQMYFDIPFVKKAAAFVCYNKEGASGTIVKSFKYKGRRDIAEYFGKLMAEEISISQLANSTSQPFFDGIDVIVPVPLTFRRRMWRGYNQTEYLARGISKVIEKPVCTNILKRKDFSVSQTRLGKWERMENVLDIFYVNTDKAETFRGKHILLIDDVITVGATTKECCKALSCIPDLTVSILGFSTARDYCINNLPVTTNK